MAQLTQPFTLKSLTLKNKVVMAPMCQYSVDAKDGIPNEWHFVHYTSRAVGGTGLIIVEMTDVDPDGRITDNDLGLWSDEQIPAYKKIVDAVHQQGAKIGIQIAHAGRKAEDANPPVAPSAIPVTENSKMPRALTTEEVRETIQQFQDAARRAVEAGFDTIELHGAHGYLIHQFHSPGINQREDEYGQDLSLFGVQIIRAVKAVIPEDMPLLMRISAVEYMDGGYDINHSIEIAKKYKLAGVDMMHISSGGGAAPGKQKPATHPGYQVPFARRFKEELNIPVIAVGILEDPLLAESVIGNGDADLVAIGRGMLKDPYWTIRASEQLGDTMEPAEQYKRAYPKK
ncbi:NADH:flavin oxidoreductase/NADH oxidase [Oceanobacillus sp. J11TS1]|uniref:NADH:flavin oxidoreductase/NADH oxidase n=1 Tax=Oceanobacillus sp. J11TS1 TaxID=2807191 RepID=UPI001B2392A3|nr:NADH:flavin oxidoreductase/NADH oxidase [Oceanobacillus sp. J11TS1]GIO24274.1 NADPH dehydrogenase [Oceanobacillus sp. J11TS1]